MASLNKVGFGWPQLTTPRQKYDLQSFPSLTIHMPKIEHSRDADDQGILQCDCTEDCFGLLIEI